jgi:serine/threonine protein kinase
VAQKLIHAFTVLSNNAITHNDIKADNILLSVTRGKQPHLSVAMNHVVIQILFMVVLIALLAFRICRNT